MGRSPVHELVNALWRALHDLGSTAETYDIECWGFSIHSALSAPGREYHNHDHVVDLLADGDPLEKIAALYHDAVYMQVDQGPPPAMKAELDTVLGPAPDGYRVLPAAASPITSDVLAVFDRQVNDIVTPTTGLNEFASALVAAIQLHEALDREQRIAIVACIEQTIPFRVDPISGLRARLEALGLTGDMLEQTMCRAVRLGNRDIDNFADNDPARFLDTTWKLLPESNPALYAPMVYTVRDYRMALQKMEAFLAWLPADRVFHSYSRPGWQEPKPEIHARRVARTVGNLELAVRYLRAKLYSISLVEAIAEVTGGDVPLAYFMGAKEQQTKRIEQYLPTLSTAEDLDPPLHKLLAEGRASESSFDTGPSPLGAFLHRVVGEGDVMKHVEAAKKCWGGGMDPLDFLLAQPAKPVAAIIRAAANIIETRRDRLFALAERLER